MSSKGFTIIELLISAAIFSLIIAGMTLVFLQQQRGYNITQDIVDVDHTARAALDYIASEIRNAGSRQGKTFSIEFDNGGSPDCDDNTDQDGTIDSPPDCLTVYTWDITKGRDGDDMPSVPGTVSVASEGPPLVLNLPTEWFKDALGNERDPPLIQDSRRSLDPSQSAIVSVALWHIPAYAYCIYLPIMQTA